MLKIDKIILKVTFLLFAIAAPILNLRSDNLESSKDISSYLKNMLFELESRTLFSDFLSKKIIGLIYSCANHRDFKGLKVLREIVDLNPNFRNLIDLKFVCDLADKINNESEYPISKIALARCLLQQDAYEAYVKDLKLKEITPVDATVLFGKNKDFALGYLKSLIPEELDLDISLIYCIHDSDEEILDILLKAGADPDFRYDDFDRTALVLSFYRGEAIIKKFINAGADLNKKTESDSRTPLMIACQDGNHDAIRILIEAGADINAQDCRGESALMIACKNEDFRTVSVLINAGANVDLQTDYGNTALMFIANKNCDNILKILLKSNADIEIKNERGRTALIIAASSGYINPVKRLIEAGADVNAQDNAGKTALMYAGDCDVLNALLNTPIDPHLKDNMNRTALWHAIKNADKNKIEMLHKYNIDINIKDLNGNAIFDFYNQFDEYIQKYLTELYPDKVQQVIDGNKLRDIITRRVTLPDQTEKVFLPDEIEEIESLIANKASLSIKEQDADFSPLFASFVCDDKIIRMMFDAGADLNAITILNYSLETDLHKLFEDKPVERAFTLLMSACAFNKIEIVNFLISKNVNLDIQDTRGNTALMQAIESNYTTIIEALIQAGARLDIENDNHETAFTLAKKYNLLVPELNI